MLASQYGHRHELIPHIMITNRLARLELKLWCTLAVALGLGHGLQLQLAQKFERNERRFPHTM